MNIEINKIEDSITAIDIPKGILDLEKTFECGQCFRWVQNSKLWHTGIVRGDFVAINRGVSTNPGVTDRFIVYMDIGKARDFLDYLSLNDDYTALEKINLTDFEADSIRFGKGIRILKQEHWETIVSFIISQRNNIPKIKTTITRLCRALGEKKQFKNPINYESVEYYTFPTAEQIVNGGMRVLDECGLGYRSEYVYNIACDYSRNYKNIDKLEDSSVSGNEAVQYFMQYKGIGPKVANCIALFGYNKLDTFPIDIWMERIINDYYNGSIDIKKFGSLPGVMQQYMFYYYRSKSLGV